MSDPRPPLIDPLTREEAETKGLGDVLTASTEGIGDDVFVRIIGRVDGYAEAIHGAMQVTQFDGGVDHRLKEIIRIQLAQTAEDPYFASLRSKPAVLQGLTEDQIQAGVADFENDEHFTAAEKWALRYAFLMYRNPDEVNASFYDEGRTFYSDAQIVEIGALIALHYGMQLFMRTLCVEPSPTPMASG